MSSNLVVSGIKIQNSPQFHMKFDGCEGVLIEKLVISTPKLSPNTDGIHIGNTKSVGIYNSMISNGKENGTCVYHTLLNSLSYIVLFMYYSLQ